MRRALAALVLLLPPAAWGFAFTAANGPQQANIHHNQGPDTTLGTPVKRTHPRPTLHLAFQGAFLASARDAALAWNAAAQGEGSPFRWQPQAVQPAAVDPCANNDALDTAGWAPDPSLCGLAASGGLGDALAVTRTNLQFVGGRWIIQETDTLVLPEGSVVAGRPIAWHPRLGGPAPSIDQGAVVLHDFYRVILHELGHALGLDHPDEAGQAVQAIMNSRTSALQSLQPDDARGVAFLYPPSGTVAVPVEATGPGAPTGASDAEGGGGGGCSWPWLAGLLLAPAVRRLSRR